MSKELKFHERIIAIQSELKAPKNQFNKFGKFAYRSCEDILEALKPLLKKHGLRQVIDDSIELIGDRYYVKSTVFVIGEDAEINTSAYAREPETKKGMDDSQVTGTASSYARKYALNGMWLIDDTKDADVKEEVKNKLSPKDKERWQTAIQNVIQEKITIEKIDELYDVDILKLREDVKKTRDKIEGLDKEIKNG
jgi:hypothetical protein